MNVLSGHGRCVQDCEVRYLPTGTAVLTVTVANDAGFGDKKKTLFIRCAIFGKQAESKLKDYLLKGRQVFFSGELSQNEYKAKDGTTKIYLELRCNDIQLLGGKLEPKKEQSNFDDDVGF